MIQAPETARLGPNRRPDAVNRRGKTIRCTITSTPLMGGQNEVRGVILLMEGSAP